MTMMMRVDGYLIQISVSVIPQCQPVILAFNVDRSVQMASTWATSALCCRLTATEFFLQDVFNTEGTTDPLDPFNTEAEDVSAAYRSCIFLLTIEQDDITFGPFSDSGAAGSDPFTFSTSFSEEMEDPSFDSFGEFGDFQSAQDGELTPTTGSWSFTSSSTASDDTGSEESGHTEDPFHAFGNGRRMPLDGWS
jgi:hypothetical protein